MFSRVVLISTFVLSLVACGGGGGGGDRSIAATPSSTLSGQVLVPNGMLASLETPSIGEEIIGFVLPSAMADLIGVSAAPNGTTVQLVRLNNTGGVDTVLAMTTINSSGRFTFNLSNLSGATPDITLAVQLADGLLAGGQQLRSFVTSNVVDITLESEVIFQRVQTEVMGAPALTDFSITEVESLVSGLRRVTTASAINTSGTINSDVDVNNTILTNNTDLINFFNAAAAGVVTVAPGNNNYMPVTQSVVYTYQGTDSVAGGYTNTTTIGAAEIIQGVTTTRFISTNIFNSDVILATDDTFTEFIANTLTGVFDFTDVQSGDSNEPLMRIPFPYIGNDEVIVLDESDVFDGEAFRITLTSRTIVNTMAVNGGALSFLNVIHTTLTLDAISSTNESVFDFFFAPGVGIIRRDFSITDSGVTRTFSEELSVMPAGL